SDNFYHEITDNDAAILNIIFNKKIENTSKLQAEFSMIIQDNSIDIQVENNQNNTIVKFIGNNEQHINEISKNISKINTDNVNFILFLQNSLRSEEVKTIAKDIQIPNTKN